ncbi:MAG: hypothetical protein ACK58T_49835, partial [Phycisphaerae bacterium]
VGGAAGGVWGAAEAGVGAARGVPFHAAVATRRRWLSQALSQRRSHERPWLPSAPPLAFTGASDRGISLPTRPGRKETTASRRD